ncbi:hypothetical protein ACQY0O_003892 [Thecaphora frezii]
MDARSSDDALPSTPPNPGGTQSPSQLPWPTRIQKQADVEKLLASLPEEDLNTFRLHLRQAFFPLKMPSQDLDSRSQRLITRCQQSIRRDFEFIVSELSALEPSRLPDWLARRIFITPSHDRRVILPTVDPNKDRRPIIPADELFQVYRTWCTSHEDFDFYSALTEFLILGLQAVPTVSERLDEKKYARYARPFAADLHGDVVQRFNDALLSDYEAEFDPKAYFGRVIPIVQSSGTGKSGDRGERETSRVSRSLEPWLGAEGSDGAGESSRADPAVEASVSIVRGGFG